MSESGTMLILVNDTTRRVQCSIVFVCTHTGSFKKTLSRPLGTTLEKAGE